MGKTLFETSWEVANKVGGIHTVLSTKAKTLVEEYGDDYITLGPWLLSQGEEQLPFEDEPGFDDFIEACRAMGVPIRVGRWLIPGRPRTILVEFSGLFEQQDGILSGLWEKQGVDSLYGGWEYIEPVLFGHACGLVIEQYWKRFLAPIRRTACAQFHEWMTGSGLLYLSEHVPSIGTVFTTHATILGRSLSSPIGLIQSATRSDQKVLTGTLENIVNQPETSSLKPPTLIIVGGVVSLHKQLNWFGN